MSGKRLETKIEEAMRPSDLELVDIDKGLEPNNLDACVDLLLRDHLLESSSS